MRLLNRSHNADELEHADELEPETHTNELHGSLPLPDGGYGWICVLSVFLINAFTWGVTASYGVYLSYYLSKESFPGSKPRDYALIGGLIYAMAMLVAPLATILSRSLGTRPPMFLGAVLYGAGFVSASFARKLWQLYLSQGVSCGLGVGLLYVPSTAIISQWFSKRRSLANAIAAAGSGIGGLIFSLATGRVISSISLGWSLRVTGIVSFAANLIAVLLIRDRNQILQPVVTGLDTTLLKQTQVLQLLAWAFVSMLGYIILQYSLSDFARSQGISMFRTDQITAYLNLGTACGRPFIGSLSDRFGRFRVAGLLTLLTGVLCFALWIPSSSFAVTAFFAVIIGAIYGVFWAVSYQVSDIKVCVSKLIFLVTMWVDQCRTLCRACRGEEAAITLVHLLAGSMFANTLLGSNRFEAARVYS